MTDEALEFCPHCGEDMEGSRLAMHIQTAHGVRHSRAQERLEASKKGRGRAIAGVFVAAIMILGAVLAIGVMNTDNNPGTTGPSDTEDTPQLVDLGGDDGGSEGGDGAGDGGDGTGSSSDGGDGGSGDGGDGTSGDGDDDDTQSQLPDDDNGTDGLAYEIPVDDIESDAKWYSHMSPDDIEIRYFLVVGPEDEIHVAFDACDVCYEANMGYRQDGNNMVCNNCDKPFPIRAIGTENKQGGCWPSYLPMKVEDDNVVIRVDDLEDGVWMFEG